MANPFKDINELDRDVNSFLKNNRSFLANQTKRISDYFEMFCYNNILRFYEAAGWEISIKNLKKNKFKYKCTTMGNPDNFSYFLMSKSQAKGKKTVTLCYWIYHNMNIQSAYHADIFTTPDIAIITPGSIRVSTTFYLTKRKYYYVENKDLITFGEAKNFTPFPELLFNFIGVVNELKPKCLKKSKKTGEHIAPSLLVSGKANQHAQKIKDSLETRYDINILFDLFSIGNSTFSRSLQHRLKKIGF